MTITSTQLSVTWAVNGASPESSYPFLILAPGQCSLVSTTNGVSTTIAPSLYSISGTGNSPGGTLVYPITGSPIPVGTSLTLTRVVPIRRVFHPARARADLQSVA